MMNKKRDKTLAMCYMPYNDMLVTGGTDRFINIYERSDVGSYILT